jgi:hypothetical protein
MLHWRPEHDELERQIPATVTGSFTHAHSVASSTNAGFLDVAGDLF